MMKNDNKVFVLVGVNGFETTTVKVFSDKETGLKFGNDLVKDGKFETFELDEVTMD